MCWAHSLWGGMMRSHCSMQRFVCKHLLFRYEVMLSKLPKSAWRKQWVIYYSIYSSFCSRITGSADGSSKLHKWCNLYYSSTQEVTTNGVNNQSHPCSSALSNPAYVMQFELKDCIFLSLNASQIVSWCCMLLSPHHIYGGRSVKCIKRIKYAFRLCGCQFALSNSTSFCW